MMTTESFFLSEGTAANMDVTVTGGDIYDTLTDLFCPYST